MFCCVLLGSVVDNQTVKARASSEQRRYVQLLSGAAAKKISFKRETAKGMGCLED